MIYLGFRIRYGMRLRSQGRLSPWIVGLWVLMAVGIVTLLFWNPRNPGNQVPRPPPDSSAPGK